MDKSGEQTPRESNGGFFSRTGSIFGGGGSRTPTSTSRPSTSGSYRETPLTATSSISSTASSLTTASSNPPPSSQHREVASSSLGSRPPLPRLRTSSVGVTNYPYEILTYEQVKKAEQEWKATKAASRPGLHSRSQSYQSNVSPTDASHRGFSSDHPLIQLERERDPKRSRPQLKMLLHSSLHDVKQRSSSIPGMKDSGFPMPGGNAPPSPSVEGLTYQHIQEMASKRISTLDYLRKAHEGRAYWFNTLLFTKADLNRLPYFSPPKMARRATAYLLLGVSLPTILDLNSSNPIDFLRALNSLFIEFEAYQHAHPIDGSASSLSRARIPQMFKRSASSMGKGRRASSAADIGGGLGNVGSEADLKSMGIGMTPSSTNFSSTDSDLLPGEEYTYLLTPSLPFEPDFYETFATLCDVLIDCYTKLMGLLSSPKDCTANVAELFAKADARIRKLIVQGLVKEVEEGTRAGIKQEMAGVGKVVLGGLM